MVIAPCRIATLARHRRRLCALFTFQGFSGLAFGRRKCLLARLTRLASRSSVSGTLRNLAVFAQVLGIDKRGHLHSTMPTVPRRVLTLCQTCKLWSLSVIATPKDCKDVLVSSSRRPLEVRATIISRVKTKRNSGRLSQEENVVWLVGLVG